MKSNIILIIFVLFILEKDMYCDRNKHVCMEHRICQMEEKGDFPGASFWNPSLGIVNFISCEYFMLSVLYNRQYCVSHDTNLLELYCYVLV